MMFSSFFEKMIMLPFILKIRKFANMKKGRGVQYFITFALSLATFTMGAFSAWPTPEPPKLISEEAGFFVTNDAIPTMLGLSTAGFILGCIASICISDFLGRKMTILASSAPFACITLLTAIGYRSYMPDFIKLLWGLGSGLFLSVVNVYLVEVSDKEIRATLSMCTSYMFSFGSLLGVTLETFMSYSTINYIMLVLPFVFLVTCLWIPESPYYYLKEGKVNHAKRSLMKLKGEENIEEELEMLQNHVKKETEKSALHLFTVLTYWRPIVIALGLEVAQIMTGVVTIQQYLGLVTQDIDEDFNLATTFINFELFKFVICLDCLVFVERIGRRPILIYSFMCTGLCFGLASVHFFLQELTRIEKTVLQIFCYVPLPSLLLMYVIFTMGFHAIIGIIQAEIFPLNVRVLAIASLNIFGGILSFVIPKFYDLINNSCGLTNLFNIISIVAYFGAFFSRFMVPETKGKSLNEIQNMFKIAKDYVPKANNGMSAVKVDENLELVEQKKIDLLMLFLISIDIFFSKSE